MAKLYQDAEKLIKEVFWNETHDPHSKLNLPKIIEEKLIEENKVKDPEYFSHRPGVVHTTSLAKCLRGVVHEMLGAEKTSEVDPRKFGVFKAGNLFEEFVIKALGSRVIHQQRQYEYRYKSILIVGRSDYTVDDEGVLRVGENKSVHSDSFWMREKEGTLIAWHNQIQLETYLWLERILESYKCEFCGKVILSNENPFCHCKDTFNDFGISMKPAPEEKLVNPQGVFSYISKDDCTVIGAPIQYNPRIIEEIIKPSIEIVNEGYEKKDPNVAPVPSLTIFSEAKHQYQKNWLCTYCEYHNHCAGAGWLLEATNLVTQRNKELKASMPKAEKKSKPNIEIVGRVEPPIEDEIPAANT